MIDKRNLFCDLELLEERINRLAISDDVQEMRECYNYALHSLEIIYRGNLERLRLKNNE